MHEAPPAAGLLLVLGRWVPAVGRRRPATGRESGHELPGELLRGDRGCLRARLLQSDWWRGLPKTNRDCTGPTSSRGACSAAAGPGSGGAQSQQPAGEEQVGQAWVRTPGGQQRRPHRRSSKPWAAQGAVSKLHLHQGGLAEAAGGQAGFADPPGGPVQRNRVGRACTCSRLPGRLRRGTGGHRPGGGFRLGRFAGEGQQVPHGAKPPCPVDRGWPKSAGPQRLLPRSHDAGQAVLGNRAHQLAGAS